MGARRTKAVALRVGVVQHTHTLVAVPGLERARHQLSRWDVAHTGLSFLHYVVLWANEAETCQRMLAELAFAENVTCVDSPTIARSLPSLAESYRYRHWWYRTTNNLTKGMYNRDWAWNNCDASYLWWLLTLGREGRAQHDYYWFLEWDLAWRGDLGMLLSRFHGTWYKLTGNGWSRDAFAVAPKLATANDLLCDTMTTVGGRAGAVATSKYGHWKKRNFTEFSLSIRACSQQLVRMSSRLAELIVHWSLRSEAYIFCEMRAGTMCAMGGPPGHKLPLQWNGTKCTVGDVRQGRQKGTMNPFSDRTFNFFANVDKLIPIDQLDNHSLPSRFFHRFKWDRARNMTKGKYKGSATPVLQGNVRWTWTSSRPSVFSGGHDDGGGLAPNLITDAIANITSFTTNNGFIPSPLSFHIHGYDAINGTALRGLLSHVQIMRPAAPNVEPIAEAVAVNVSKILRALSKCAANEATLPSAPFWPGDRITNTTILARRVDEFGVTRGMVQSQIASEISQLHAWKPHKRSEIRVIAYGLYGAKERYTVGAIRNAELAPLVFPTWTVRIYLDHTVPSSVVKLLELRGAQLKFMGPSDFQGTSRGKFWRFVVASDPTVDR